MHLPVSCSLIRRVGLFALAATAVCLTGGGTAWAGGASGFVFPLQMILDNTCSMVGITSSNCPQLPTTNQLVIEIAALTNTSPEDVRAMAIPGAPINPMGATDGGSQGGVVTPLAFISPSNKLGSPVPTQPNNPAANSFVSTTLSNGMLDITFDYKPRTNPIYASGQDVGDITLPVAVADASGNLLRDVSAMLQIRGTGGTAVTTDIVGDFLGTGTPQTDPLSALGMSFSLNFTNGFAEFDVDVPLLIDAALQPAYSFSAPGFEFDPTGGLFDGIDPVADFLTASFVNDANDPPAINADLAISSDGDTVLSAPGLPEPPTLTLIGSAFVGLGLASMLRRRRALGWCKSA